MGIFSKLLPGKKNSSQGARRLGKTSPSDEYRIKQTLGIRRLESMPAQAAKAFQLASDPRSTLNDFISIIESDEVLSARIMKVANSVYFRRGEPAEDIGCGVANIGLDEIRCILSATMLKSLLKGRSKYRDMIWANAVAVGIASKELASYTNIPSGKAFLCGILHDVGKLIMLQKHTKKYESILASMYQSEQASVELEAKSLELDHTLVGKWLAERWHFPEAVRRAIFLHHQQWPKESSKKGKDTSAAMLVKCADTMCHALRLGHPNSHTIMGKVAEESLQDVCAQLTIDKEQLSRVMDLVEKKFDIEFSMYSSEL